MPTPLGRPIRTFLASTVTAASLTAVSLPAHAGDGGAFAAGLIGGTAVGALAGRHRERAAAPRLLLSGLCPTATALLVATTTGVDRLCLDRAAGARL
jgi:hypothetical protein